MLLLIERITARPWLGRFRWDAMAAPAAGVAFRNVQSRADGQSPLSTLSGHEGGGGRLPGILSARTQITNANGAPIGNGAHWSLIWRKIDGRWLITHMHISIRPPPKEGN